MDEPNESSSLLQKESVTTERNLSCCEKIKDPNSLCHRLIVLFFMCFLSFGEFYILFVVIALCLL